MNEKIETRGRKSLPLDKKKPPQATVKINDFILPLVKELKGNLKKGVLTKNTLAELFSVLRGEKEQQASVFKDSDSVGVVEELQNKIHQLDADKRILEKKLILQKDKALELVIERDREKSNLIQANSKLESLKSSYRLVKNDYSNLLHKEYDCMAITGSGDRCTKKAVIDAEYHQIFIHVCLQHSKALKK